MTYIQKKINNIHQCLKNFLHSSKSFLKSSKMTFRDRWIRYISRAKAIEQFTKKYLEQEKGRKEIPVSGRKTVFRLDKNSPNIEIENRYQATVNNGLQHGE